MSEKLEIMNLTGFASDPLDEGLDVNALPYPPWQPRTVGLFTFKKLAAVMGCGESLAKNPTLDARTFGGGRANRQIALYGLTAEIQPVPTGEGGDTTPGDYKRADEANVERLARLDAIKAEGQKLQDAINLCLPELAGTPRSERAQPLTPTKSTLKQSGADIGFIKK